MGERRKWDKQSAFHPSSAAQGSGGGVDPYASPAANGANDPVLEKQRQYIKMLEERNRLKKKLAAASKTQKEKGHLQEREEAFVTTFNVPKAAGSHHHSGSGSSGTTVRKNKSAASLLPTKMAPPPSCASSSSASSLLGARNFDSDRQSQCKSAPMTTLNFQRVTPAASAGSGAGDLSARGDGDLRPDAQQRGATRAKWSKPQGPMNVAVENRDGQAHFCLTDQVLKSIGESDAKHSDGDRSPRLDRMKQSEDDADDDDSDEKDDVEESYLEESFEEFEDEEGDASDGGCEEIIAEAKDFESKRPVSCLRSAKASGDDGASENGISASPSATTGSSDNDSESLASVPVLSRTTTELFDIIQHLSRSKQKALTDVLQRFQTSERRESDVKELQSSIGDPQIWKQMTATLFSNTTTEKWEAPTIQRAKPVDSKASPKVVDSEPPSTSLAQVLQEQKEWEEEYAQQLKERLAKERKEKEKAMRDAEERRMAMMRQLEEEEKELEQLMEQKRQERLAKLRALEQEVESVPVVRAASSSMQQRKPNAERTIPESDSVLEPVSPTDRLRASASSSGRSSAQEEKRRGKSISPTKRSSKKKLNKERQSSSSLEDDLLVLTSEAKPAHSTELTLKAHDDERSPPRSKPKPTGDDDDAAHGNTKPAPVVPLLKLGSVCASISGYDQPCLSSVELRIKVLSTWGKTRAVGLTQISVYDINGVELAVDATSLKIFDQSDSQSLSKSHEMVRGLNRLFNGIAYTNREQDMWLGRLSDSGMMRIVCCLNLWALCATTNSTMQVLYKSVLRWLLGPASCASGTTTA